MSSGTPKAKLLAAVVDVALADGIADQSLRAIAEAAGTSHRMLIHHFGSREALLVEVIRAVEEQQRAAFRELQAGPAGPPAGGAGADSAPASGAAENGAAENGAAENGAAVADLAYQFWKRLRGPALGPQERLFFEVYGQALRGRAWAEPLLDGIIEDWAAPLTATLTAAGAGPQAAAAARLSVAVTRGLLLDVLATGDEEATDAAMRYFLDILFAHISGLAPQE